MVIGVFLRLSVLTISQSGTETVSGSMEVLLELELLDSRRLLLLDDDDDDDEDRDEE